jgi:hypothetical protein
MAAPPARTFVFTYYAPSPQHRLSKNALLIAAGAALAAAFAAYRRRRNARIAGGAGAGGAARPSAGDVGVGGDALETRAAVDALLQAAFGRPEEVLPYEAGPKVGQRRSSTRLYPEPRRPKTHLS